MDINILLTNIELIIMNLDNEQSITIILDIIILDKNIVDNIVNYLYYHSRFIISAINF